MTEVGLADRLELLRQKRAEYSSIVRSRKRKLRELYAVATDGDGALNLNKFDVDAPPTKPGETKFLLDTDILQGRSLSDARIPTRHKPDLETLKQFFASANGSSSRHEPPVIARHTTDTPTPPTSSTHSYDASRFDHDSSSHASSSARTPQPTPTPTPAAASLNLNPNSAAKPSAARPPATTPNATRLEADNSSEASARNSNSVAALAASIAPKVADNTPQNAAPHQAPAAGAAAVTPNPLEQDKRASATQASPDPMDVDTEAKAAKPVEAADHHGPNGITKTADIPSSPESTVQTATTPAVHDVSVNTSPENDADSYIDRDEKTDRRQSQTKAAGLNDEPRDDTVEAQLLHESAAAVGNQKDVARQTPAASKAAHDQVNGSAETGSTPKSLPAAVDVDDESSDKTDKSQSASATETAAQVASNQKTLERLAESPSIIAALPTPKPSTGDASENLHLSELVVANTRKIKRRAPTVLFGKQKKTKPDTTIIPSNLNKSENLFSEDYFTPLFVQTFSQNAKWMKNMDQLVHHARKTLSSADNQAAMFDTQSCKILKRDRKSVV